ncbi:MAG: hypothetical protein MMC23_000001 [Stictis urceolatum]|nr:hypothetical protein [Stictis urceolata]
MSGGMNYIDWLTSHYNTTETYTFDFAHSQATVSNNLSPVDGVPSFEDQVATLYKPKYSDKPADVAPWTGDNTIFTVFFGINDIQNNYKTGAIDTFIPQTLDLYFAQIQALYDTGARKLVFVGVPPLDRSPRVMQEDPSGAGTWSQWQTNYNAQLAQRANDFGGSHSDAQIAIYDFNVFFASVLDDPVGHGFNDATCVGDGVKCIWNDIFHPTYTFDFLWAGDMLNILKNVDW